MQTYNQLIKLTTKQDIKYVKVAGFQPATALKIFFDLDTVIQLDNTSVLLFE